MYVLTTGTCLREQESPECSAPLAAAREGRSADQVIGDQGNIGRGSCRWSALADGVENQNRSQPRGKSKENRAQPRGKREGKGRRKGRGGRAQRTAFVKNQSSLFSSFFFGEGEGGRAGGERERPLACPPRSTCGAKPRVVVEVTSGAGERLFGSLLTSLPSPFTPASRTTAAEVASASCSDTPSPRCYSQFLVQHLTYAKKEDVTQSVTKRGG